MHHPDDGRDPQAVQAQSQLWLREEVSRAKRMAPKYGAHVLHSSWLHELDVRRHHREGPLESPNERSAPNSWTTASGRTSWESYTPPDGCGCRRRSRVSPCLWRAPHQSASAREQAQEREYKGG